MKKIYETPIIEIITISNENILNTSEIAKFDGFGEEHDNDDF